MFASRNGVDADGRGVGRWQAIEDLHGVRHFCFGRVTGKTVNGEAGGVREQAAQRHLFRGGELIVGDFPLLQVLVDVGIEFELARVHQVQRRQCEHGFADGRRLEQRVLRDRRAVQLGDAVTACPVDAALVDDRHADAGDLERGHALGQGRQLGLFTLDQHHRR